MARWLGKYVYYLRSIRTLLTGIEQALLVVRIFAGIAGRGPRTIRLRRSGVRFRVRHAMDVWSVKEAFLDRLYETYGFRIEPDWSVVDVGAGIGELAILADWAGARVIAFEPHPGSFALLEENLRLNDAARVQAVDLALGGREGAAMLNGSSDNPLLYRTGEAGTERQGKIEVDMTTLGDALDRFGVDRVDLLKLDCEGAEYDILRNARAEVLARVDRIVLEYHDWNAAPDHPELVWFLERAGYTVETFPNPVHAVIGYLRATRIANDA